MRMYLAETSALTFWRGRLKLPPFDKFEIPGKFIPSLKKEEASWLAKTYGIVLPATSAVAAKDARRKSNVLHCLVHGSALPKNEYLFLGMDTFVASPELTLAQLAGKLACAGFLPDSLSKHSSISAHASAVILASLMTEFCGRYVIFSSERDGLLERKPLTSLSSILKFLDRCDRFQGRKAFEQAVALAFDNSRSPAETNLALMECLKYCMGGMSFAQRPILNAEVETPLYDCAHMRSPDQLFKDLGEVIEYNGGRHEGERANDDDRRRSELRSAGYIVTVVNSNEFLQAEALEKTLQIVRDKVGTTGRQPADYRKRRADLRSLLFELSGTKCWENRECLLPAALLPPRTQSSKQKKPRVQTK